MGDFSIKFFTLLFFCNYSCFDALKNKLLFMINKGLISYFKD